MRSSAYIAFNEHAPRTVMMRVKFMVAADGQEGWGAAKRPIDLFKEKLPLHMQTMKSIDSDRSNADLSLRVRSQAQKEFWQEVLGGRQLRPQSYSETFADSVPLDLVHKSLELWTERKPELVENGKTGDVDDVTLDYMAARAYMDRVNSNTQDMLTLHFLDGVAAGMDVDEFIDKVIALPNTKRRLQAFLESDGVPISAQILHYPSAAHASRDVRHTTAVNISSALN